jgi:hypothetical protein
MPTTGAPIAKGRRKREARMAVFNIFKTGDEW